MSSLRGRVVLLSCLAASCSCVLYITQQQQVEKVKMHRAVVVDKKRLAERAAAAQAEADKNKSNNNTSNDAR